MRRNLFAHSVAAAAAALLAAGPLAADQAVSADQALSRKVEEAILQLPRYGPFDMISFQVTGGTVSLLGAVATAPLKEDGEKAVAGIPGVARVVNSIEVLPLSKVDDRLRHEVFRRIYRDPFLSKYGTPLSPGVGVDAEWGPGAASALGRESVGRYAIHVIVKGGRVALYGLVDNDVDRAKAIQAARSVPGVLSVDDRMEASSSRKPT